MIHLFCYPYNPGNTNNKPQHWHRLLSQISFVPLNQRTYPRYLTRPYQAQPNCSTSLMERPMSKELAATTITTSAGTSKRPTLSSATARPITKPKWKTHIHATVRPSPAVLLSSKITPSSSYTRFCPPRPYAGNTRNVPHNRVW
ncbi:hypothetical protein VTJ04DRAFT_1466 [Mycothermus thermophilus]|uniref:uncharacterized protein n=1 Tax=Humicola insolens TaxID=85995 RepID=UPI0037445B7E